MTTDRDGGAAMPLRDQLASQEQSDPPWEFKHHNPEPFPDPPENLDDAFNKIESNNATDEDRQVVNQWRATEQAWSFRDRLCRMVQWRYTVADAMLAARTREGE